MPAGILRNVILAVGMGLLCNLKISESWRFVVMAANFTEKTYMESISKPSL
jgi:hypothetical protein